MNNEKWSWEEFYKVATILGFVLNLITLTLLLVNSLPPSPVIDNQVWIIFQYAILTLGVVTYLGFLRRKWRENLASKNISFSQYFVGLFKFEQIFILIPLILFLFFLLTISLQVNTWLNILIWIAVFTCIGYPFYLSKQEQMQIIYNEWSQSEYQRAESNLDEWIPRINKNLNSKSYLTNLELAQNYGEDRYYCACLLHLYFNRFTDTEDLIFRREYLARIINPKEMVEFYVLSYRMLANSKPWCDGFFVN